MAHLELARKARVNEEAHVLQRTSEAEDVAGLVIVVVLVGLKRRPCGGAHQDVGALQGQGAGHLGVGLVEADHEPDLAEARIEHRVVAIARVDHDALGQRQVHLAVLAHVAVGADHDHDVVQDVPVIRVLLDHAPGDVDVVLLRQIDEVLGGRPLGHQFSVLMLIAGVIRVENEHRVLGKTS